MVNKPVQLILIIICAVVSIVFAYIGYQYGIKHGSDNGYRAGYANRTDEYKQIGYKEGNESGYIIGQKEGYDVGYHNGWDEGERYTVKVACPDSYPHPPTSLYNDYHPTLTNPTYSQLMEFLRVDKTEDLTYSDNFTCWGFAITMKRNAEKQGIRCAIVSMSFKNELTKEPTMGHVINMFVVTDPPQEGDGMDLLLPGGKSWRLMKGNPEFYVDAQYGGILRHVDKGGSYDWYLKYSELQYEDNYDRAKYYEDRGGGFSWGFAGQQRVSDEERWRLKPDSRYTGNQDEIKRYLAGPFVKASDTIAKMIVIW